MAFSEACVAASGCSTSGSAFPKPSITTKISFPEACRENNNRIPSDDRTGYAQSGDRLTGTAASMNDDKLKAAPLAYQNEPFLNSPDGRILRILSEYAEPLSRFRREQIQDTVVFFGSARFQSREVAERALKEAQARGGRAPKA